MKPSTASRPHSLRAFTLVEILIAVTLFGVAISSTLGFYLYAMRTYQFDIGKCLVNSDFRRFTDQMVNNVTFASQIYILPSFTERTITTTYTDPITFATSTVTNLNTVANSTSGDFMVLVYQDPTTTNIVRLVGYYRAEDSSMKNYGANQFPVRMFDIALDQPATTNIATLLPSTSTLNSSAHRLLFLDSTGLGNPNATTSAAGIFTNINGGRTVVVNGELCNRGNNIRKKVSNKYNFTVSRRS
ncbi:MAG TPA: prepilin-type N-terminal cleavage/methylation domain-containing protein [Opitutaceae bacterium]|nr:prepilin-type N-terminal cleavage/methylation domain-containing protein [Opitutaceae bacterium]HOR25395.1 prepilin-type N-terminal cleavage/methylation domain-containing protein [Opitutaceae bacterium]HPK50144.1 prepilin-type N-terminal cleavage/methylation domain-containing protein [Opitutaceae bacterium]